MSRFVSAGASDQPTERDEAWLKAQQQIEAARQQTQQKPRPGEQEDGKSLYETLQANKAAKQEKFEEENRLRNQFRSLDNDEVEFLDSVMESTRTKEAEVKKQTKDQLDAFRRQQLDAEKAASQTSGGDGKDDKPAATETWAAGPRKRKKGKEGLVGGIKVRRTSTAEQHKSGADASPESPSKQQGSLSPPAAERGKKAAESPDSASAGEAKAIKESPASSPPKPSTKVLGLGAYSSDEDD